MSATAFGPIIGISNSRVSGVTRRSPTVAIPMRCSAFSHRRRRIDRSNASRSAIDSARIPAMMPDSPPQRRTGPGPDDTLDRVAARQHVSIDLDADVAAILRAHAAEAHLSEGEIVDRAIRAYDLRSLLAQIRERSDLDEDEAIALAREELKAARAERDAAA
jgi:hypothetical protein